MKKVNESELKFEIELYEQNLRRARQIALSLCYVAHNREKDEPGEEYNDYGSRYFAGRASAMRDCLSLFEHLRGLV